MHRSLFFFFFINFELHTNFVPTRKNTKKATLGFHEFASSQKLHVLVRKKIKRDCIKSGSGKNVSKTHNEISHGIESSKWSLFKHFGLYIFFLNFDWSHVLEFLVFFWD